MQLQTSKPDIRLDALAFYFVLLIILLNVFTPLRLNTDGIRYLNILEFLKGNLDSHSGAAADFFPHGYPMILLVLDKLSLLKPASIVLINTAVVALSALIAARMLAVKSTYLCAIIVLLSFVNVKQYTLPLSDQLFMLTFIAACWLWTQFFEHEGYWLAAAVILSIISIFIRTAGISIFLGVIFYFIYKYHKIFFVRLAVWISLLLGLGIFFYNLDYISQKIDYFRQLQLSQMISSPGTIKDRLLLHLQELGELVINMPFSKLVSLTGTKSSTAILMILYIVGVLLIGLLARAIFTLKFYRTFLFWAFAAYFLMILVWPFYDTRFFIPIIPVIVAVLYRYYQQRSFNIFLRRVPVSWYLLMGSVSLVFSCAISLNKSFFLKHYGNDPRLTEKYREYFKARPTLTGSAPLHTIQNNNILYLLETYD